MRSSVQLLKKYKDISQEIKTEIFKTSEIIKFPFTKWVIAQVLNQTDNHNITLEQFDIYYDITNDVDEVIHSIKLYCIDRIVKNSNIDIDNDDINDLCGCFDVDNYIQYFFSDLVNLGFKQLGYTPDTCLKDLLLYDKSVEIFDEILKIYNYKNVL